MKPMIDDEPILDGYTEQELRLFIAFNLGPSIAESMELEEVIAWYEDNML